MGLVPDGMRRACPRCCQRGVTLVEILIGLTVGLALTGGVLKIYADNRNAYRLQEGLSRLQENGRFALETMAADIRTAGFLGCFGDDFQVINILRQIAGSNSYLYDFNVAVQGHEASGNTWAPTADFATLFPNAVVGSDLLTLRGTSGSGIRVTQRAVSSAAAVMVEGTAIEPNNDLQAGEIAVVSDCRNATIFQITNLNNDSSTVTHAPGNAGSGQFVPGNAVMSDTPPPPCVPGGLCADYAPPEAELLRLSTISYYVRPGQNGIPSLWRRAGTDAWVELVEGVESLQILYGEDTDATADGTANRYVTADQVGDFDDVVSIRLSLLLRTIENNLVAQSQQYFFNGATVGATDRAVRRVFNATIGIRNRLPTA